MGRFGESIIKIRNGAKNPWPSTSVMAIQGWAGRTTCNQKNYWRDPGLSFFVNPLGPLCLSLGFGVYGEAFIIKHYMRLEGLRAEGLKGKVFKDTVTAQMSDTVGKVVPETESGFWDCTWGSKGLD